MLEYTSPILSSNSASSATTHRPGVSSFRGACHLARGDARGVARRTVVEPHVDHAPHVAAPAPALLLGLAALGLAALALAALAREDVPDEVAQAYKVDRLQYGPDYIIPTPFDPRLISWVPPFVAQAAIDSGVARKPLEDVEFVSAANSDLS